jgi:hypothetical protein
MLAARDVRQLKAALLPNNPAIIGRHHPRRAANLSQCERPLDSGNKPLPGKRHLIAVELGYQSGKLPQFPLSLPSKIHRPLRKLTLLKDKLKPKPSVITVADYGSE